MKTKKFRPYIRRANGREQATTLKMACRLAFYQMRGRKFYVMVQHGFPNLVLEVGATKRAIMQSFPMLHWFTFREFAKQLQRRALFPERSKRAG